MDAHPVAWGLDIGHAAIKAVKLARQGGSVVVQGYVIEPIAQEGEREKVLVDALRHLAQREEFGSTPVYASLSGKQVLSRTTNIPVLGSAKDLGRIVTLEAQQQIPGDFNAVEWGYHLSPGSDGGSYDVALFAVKRTELEQLIGQMRAAGLNLMGVVPASLALYNFIRFDQEFPSDETVIVLDVGAQNTDLVFYQGDSVSISSLDVSGNDITEAFVKKFRVTRAEAERLKREVGDSRQADRIIKVIEGTLGDLIAGVQRRIGFHKTQRPDAKFENLVISGSTFRMPGLPEYLAEKLRYTINILEDLDRIQVAPGLPKDNFMNDLQGLGVALGLGLQATGVSKSKVNLMPSAMKLERVLTTKRWAGLVAVALLAVGWGVVWVVKGDRIDYSADILKKIDEESTLASQNPEVRKAQEQLDSVALKGAELRRYAFVGNQQGVASRLLAQVAGLVEKTIRDLGPQVDSGPAEATRRSEVLSGIYLSEVKLSDQAVMQDPFQPFATARQLELTVHFLAGDQAEARLAAFRSALTGLTVSSDLMAAHPAGPAWIAQAAQAQKGGSPPPSPPKLFSEVRVTFEGSDPGFRDYWFFDPHHVNQTTGNVEPLSIQNKLNGLKVTFACTLPVVGATP